jgi:hypothetical protein
LETKKLVPPSLRNISYYTLIIFFLGLRKKVETPYSSRAVNLDSEKKKENGHMLNFEMMNWDFCRFWAYFYQSKEPSFLHSFKSLDEMPYTLEDFHELSEDRFHAIFYESFAPGEKELKLLKNFPSLEKNNFTFRIRMAKDTIQMKGLFASLSISQDFVSVWYIDEDEHS